MSSTQEAGEIFGAGGGPAHAMLRSPTVLIASVGLWGMNLFFFRLFRIDYVKVMKHDLLKLEDSDSELQEGKETTTAVQHRSPCSSNAPIASQQQQQQQQQLIQRQPSNGGTLVAAAAAVSGQSSSAQQHSDDDDDDTNDDEEQQYGDSSSPEVDLSISWEKLVGLSMVLLVLLHSTYYWWLEMLKGGTIGAVLMFYAFVTLAIALPFRCTRWLQKATFIVLQRTFELINPRCHCITNDGVTPPRFIPFVDVFYADAMCSLSKVFFDWGMLIHMASHYPNPVPASAHNILIPSAFAALPYVIRARQCLIMYTVGRIKKERNRFSHLWNALKYTTSIFPLCLSAYQKTISKRAGEDLENVLILLLVINSVFALYWDIVMDWGMMQENPIGVAVCNTGSKTKTLLPNPHKAAAPTNCAHSVLRPRLRFGIGMSALILLIDCVLRFSWMLRFAKSAIFPSSDSFVLCTQFLEVFRRALWNLLRVEWENMKLTKTMSTKASNIMETTTTAGAVADEEMKAFLPVGGKLNTL
ncbi:hypothetical protein ACA910_020748 [Epithemia clementina (nom. ined.)]